MIKTILSLLTGRNKGKSALGGLTVLMGMLGLGGLRTYEKIKDKTK
jgi:hypothetical protein